MRFNVFRTKLWTMYLVWVYNYLRSHPKLLYPYNYFRFGKWTNDAIPNRIVIEVTNYCNAHCFMCPNSKIKRKRGFMSWKVFKKIIDDAKEFEGTGLEIILHKDGEPLLDNMLFKRIAYVKKNLKKSKVSFNTNAYLLSEEKAKKLLKSDVDIIIFSVDGTSNLTYNKIRGLDYNIVEKNIKVFFNLKKKSGSKIHAIMQMIVYDDNMYEIEEYKKLWFDADEVVFKRMHNYLDQGTSIKTNKLEKRQIRRCYQVFNQLHIFWNGDIALCCWDYDHFLNLGNIMDAHLLTVYKSKNFIDIRKAMWGMDCKHIIPCNRCSEIFGYDRGEN